MAKTRREPHNAQAKQERRESTIDIMASWALDGMTPTPEVLARIRAYVDGEVTLDEAIAQAKVRYAPDSTHDAGEFLVGTNGSQPPTAGFGEYLMPDATTHAEVHKSIQDLIETVETQGQDDELVVILLREVTDLIKRRQPRGGALSDDQVAFLIEADAFTPREFAETEASLARGDLARLERKTRLEAITDSLNAAGVAQVLSIDVARVRRRQAKGDLYSFLIGGRRRYPLWQFASDPARPVLPGLAALVKGIPEDMHPASVQGFMTTPQEDLLVDCERVTPAEWLLRDGDPQALLDILGSFLQS